MQIKTKPIQSSFRERAVFATLLISLIGFSALVKVILAIPNQPLVTPGGWITIGFLLFWVTKTPDSKK